jgi:predicted ATPase/DNA-binding SARP family transcriptional activator/Tfp pilus assembly protein PilF
LHLFLLGPPRLERDNAPIALDRHKSLALLAYLATTRKHQSRDELAALLWPDFDQTSARASLRRVLAALKKEIGEASLDADRDLIGLKPEADLLVDVEDMQRRLAECETHGHPPAEVCQACLAPLSEAAALYQGDFMAGFSLRDSPGFEEWLLLQAESLRRALSGALARLVHGHTAQREFDAAVAYARRWLALDTLNEAAHRDLMRLYAWSDRHAAALSQYRECQDILKKELGLPPQEETTRLHEAIKANRLEPPPARYLPVPLTAPARRPHNLPLQITSFVGREEELAAIGRLLANPACRLISLVGPGGIGKTRLAIQSAAQHVDAFRHGVYYAALASLSSPDLVISTLADALKFSFHGSLDPKAQLLSFLREKDMLLVMDNFEHLTGATPLIVDILQSAPQVKALVTSRERLNLQGEWSLEIGGLKYPRDGRRDGGADYSAVNLFVESAQRQAAAFQASEADQRHIVRICQLVDGAPLAIELAAAWVRALPPGEIAAEIEKDIGFLATSQANVPERHRSLRAVFDYSWNLLGEAERAAAMGLSVFRGGFRREAAESVGDASADLLSSLVDKSFLRRHTAGRYDVHDLLRQYLARKLEADPAREQAVRERYAQHYAEFLRRREKLLRAGRQKEVLDEIGEEIENVRAVWRWAVAQARWDVIGRCTESLFFFYDLRSLFQEGADAFGQAAERWESMPGLAERAADQRALASLLAKQARCLMRFGRFDAARALFRSSLDLHTRLAARDEMGFALTYLGDIHRMKGEYEEARRLLREGVEAATASGDGYILARALNSLGVVASLQGDYELADRLYRNSLSIQKEIGDQIGMSLALNNLGGIAFLRGDHARARYLYEESLAIQAEINDLRGAAVSLDNIAEVMQAQNDQAGAKRILQESLAIKKDIGDRHGTAYSLNKLGQTAGALNQSSEAQTHFLAALRLALEVKVVPLALNILAGVAALWARLGDSAPALEVLEFALNHPAIEQEARDRAESLRAQIVSELEPHIVAAAQDKARSRTLDELAEEVWAQSGAASEGVRLR